MNIKHSEIIPKPEKPFENCKLGRQKYAEVLTNIINSYPNGFVLAINNNWGTGKTTFIKMWEQQLKNQGYQTIYFNAWENDFENNPLIALMGELKTITNKSTEPKFKSALKKAATLSKHIAPIIAKAIADKYVSTEVVKEAIDGVTKGLTDVFENDVNEYAKKKKSVIDFRKSLSDFIADTNKGKPLIFIIDELDRCRPDYAVSVLEQIKHFFSVQNITFILSIDKEQLGNAICGVYGSDKINTNEYLRRFIDIEYSIPQPDGEVYYKYLYDYFKFDEFFKSDERLKYVDFQDDKESFLRICKLLFTNISISLRQQEKIFSLSRLALRSFTPRDFVLPNTFIFLVFLKIVYPKFYDNLKNKKLTISQVQEEFFTLVKDFKNKGTERQLIVLEAHLLNFYNNFLQPGYDRKKLYTYNKEVEKNVPEIGSVMDIEGHIFLSILENLYSERVTIGDFDLEHFLTRIELLENFGI